uniref:F-box domain-containing protein n=2 Tax=Parascaris univalens TaxID=6257 RepID=A0A915AQM3_PARUN
CIFDRQPPAKPKGAQLTQEIGMRDRHIKLCAAHPVDYSSLDDSTLALLSGPLPGGSNAAAFDRIQKLVLRCGFISLLSELKQPLCYLNSLPDKVLLAIVSMLPIRERIANVSVLDRRLHRLVRSSITSVSFYRDELDALCDERLQLFMKQFGSQLLYANLDLYRSCLAPSQWKWRTSIKSVVSMCWGLRSLDILFCHHHKLRDADLIDVFKSCPHLVNLRIDAQFIRGHSFQHAPRSMQRLELEMCYRIDQTTFHHITARLHKLKSLHVSQLLILSDNIIVDIVKNLPSLTDLSLVSHPETVYEELTGAGLGALARLRKLRSLCTEGLAAVTDRFLILISDEKSPAAKSITSLSLAFCFNLSMHGLFRLARMPKLCCLNLDGITKRDIGMGVERIASGQRLTKLFLAEGTNISPDSLVRIVRSSPLLRTLDISSNERIYNYSFAQEIVSFWVTNFGSHLTLEGNDRACYRPLYILTDEHLPWNTVKKPELDQYGRTVVTVVHLQREFIPEEEVLPTTILSRESPLRLPSGVMAPLIRRGNRYRLMWSALGPGHEPRLSISPTLQLDLSAFIILQPPNPTPADTEVIHGSLDDAATAAEHEIEVTLPEEVCMGNGLTQMGSPAASVSTAIFPNTPSRAQLSDDTVSYGQFLIGMPSLDTSLPAWPISLGFISGQTGKENLL